MQHCGKCLKHTRANSSIFVKRKKFKIDRDLTANSWYWLNICSLPRPRNGYKLRLQFEFNLLSTDEVTPYFEIQTYEHGDKTSRLLARQARQAAASRSITKIQSHTGKILMDHKDINKAFQDYYVNLYTSECRNDKLLCMFFENLNVPTVSEEQNSNLSEGTLR